jgi:hypothetical protein
MTLYQIILNIFFLNEVLVDIEPIQLVPTWRNGRATDQGVAKILDRFLITDQFLVTFEKYMTWVGVELISNYQPIWLQVDLKDGWKPITFKFNHHWLKDKEFQNLVLNSWSPFSSNLFLSSSTHLLENLKVLK